MTNDLNHLIESISAELRVLADDQYRELVRTKYNMNVDRFWGVRTPQIHKIAGLFYRDLKPQPIAARLRACDALLATGVYEHKITAFRWAHLARREFEARHLDVFKRWLDDHVDDWIDCDDLSIHVIGEFFLAHPERAPDVLAWSSSPNPWTRRGAVVSLVLPTRRGQQLALALQIVSALLKDPEDLVVKACGWLLKEASKAFPDEVFEYVMAHRASMPRIALRYAVEKLPEAQQRQAMEMNR